jgi:hypothetical protein
LNVGGSVYLRDGFFSAAEILLEGAQIASALDGTRGTFWNNGRTALVLNSAKIGGFCTFAFAAFCTTAAPAIRAEGTLIGGFLSLARARIEGLLLLRGVQIGANLNLAGAALANPGSEALNLERAKIAGSILMNPHERLTAGKRETVPTSVVGSIRLIEASIDWSVVIEDAGIVGAGDPTRSSVAIAAEGLRVGSYLSLVRSSFLGLVMLRDLQVGRTVNLSGARISNPGKAAFDAERAKIGGDLFIRPFERPGELDKKKPALITGGVIISGATIGGSLFVVDDSLKNHEKEDLLFNRMNVAGVFRFANIQCGNGRLSFANAKTFAFIDDGTVWPEKGLLWLNGFEYGSLSGNASTSWRSRLDWLRRYKPDEFNPQPFTTLVTVLQRAGHDWDAKKIAIARHREARKYVQRGAPRWMGSILMDVTCGHGYRSWLAVMWIVLFIGIGFAVFNLDPADRVPLKDTAAALYHAGKPLPDGYPPYQPLIYSADVLLPIVNLQQKDYWAPNSDRPRGYYARLYLPVHILAGWFFTTLFVVGVTGLIRRD